MAAFGAGAALNFRRTLERHLDAIQRSAAELLDAHRGWFAMKNWTLKVTEEAVHETPGSGIAVLRLLYEEPGVRQESLLTLVFEKRGEQWLMVFDQNTPSN